MEKWVEYFKGKIPRAIYEINIKFGEANGLILELLNKGDIITIEFGNIISFRVLEEGYVQADIYSNDEVNKYKASGFSNVIYCVEDGKYANDIKEIADGYLDIMDYYHFIIITQNYNIDIITEYLPHLYYDRIYQ